MKNIKNKICEALVKGNANKTDNITNAGKKIDESEFLHIRKGTILKMQCHNPEEALIFDFDKCKKNNHQYYSFYYKNYVYTDIDDKAYEPGDLDEDGIPYDGSLGCILYGNDPIEMFYATSKEIKIYYNAIKNK